MDEWVERGMEGSWREMDGEKEGGVDDGERNWWVDGWRWVGGWLYGWGEMDG